MKRFNPPNVSQEDWDASAGLKDTFAVRHDVFPALLIGAGLWDAISNTNLSAQEAAKVGRQLSSQAGYKPLPGYDSEPHTVKDTASVADYRLARTKNNQLIHCPSWTRANDESWIFYGSPVPLILRPVNPSVRYADAQAYDIIGECYVHGYMNGEMAASGMLGPTAVILIV